MLFHVFKWKALRCPKDVSALDDLVHDFVYCLQLSLVLKVQRLFPWLLRFPRREKPHGYWTLSTCNGPEKRKGPGVRGRVLFQAALSRDRLSGEGTGAAPGSPRRACRAGHVLLLPRLTPASPAHPSPESGLGQTRGSPFLPRSCHPTVKQAVNLKTLHAWAGYFAPGQLSHWGFCVLLKNDWNKPLIKF